MVADVAWLKVVDYSGATMSGVAMRSVISHVIVSAVAKCSRKGAAVVLTGGLDEDGDRQRGNGEDGAIGSGEDSAGGEDGGRLRQGAFLRW